MNEYKLGEQVFFKTGKRRFLPVVVREINLETQSVVGAVVGDDGKDMALFEWSINKVYKELPNG
jgi:hypothetical protein